MGFNCGIVGLPNVGKSTLFNALTATQSAQAANYPFCTIEPNVGRVGIPDPRLYKLAAIAKSINIIPTQLEFVDIAGLVRGASKGEGLGNQFLGHIRAVDAIIHVLRCFEDDDITHVDGSVDPLRDLQTIETELLFADMESLEKRLNKKTKTADALSKDLNELAAKILPQINSGVLVSRISDFSTAELELLPHLQLLTSKPILYVCNVSESEAASGNNYTKQVQSYAQNQGAGCVVISAAIESEVAQLPHEEQQEFLVAIGLSETGLNQVIRAGYGLLNLLTFFTVGPKEARSWNVYKGAKAPQAAGAIHTDFERGFICAETISYDDYVLNNGEAGSKTAGKLRLEGRDYSVQDGDVFHFRFNV